ncbi:HNH endonuclease [Mesorhizobium sp. NPDC059025]|uniref:HNH endonuclease n=1 Tax=unclassified Mesorhizobium TaxID=325217 RepID=UPI0036AEAD3E
MATVGVGSYPKGTASPQRVEVLSGVFLRDPRVKAFVLERAHGRCECCASPAPFKTVHGDDYLEVHHMKPLANGGSDTVHNAVALCANCHRALHYSANALDLAGRVYESVPQLVRE